MLTVADYFCGAGGSSSGMEQVPGVRVVMAANHWDLAIATHNANLPHADHDVADVAAIDPRRHPTTDIGWFSPECTNWSIARGKKVDYDGKPTQLNLFDQADERPLPDEAAQRSRMLMQDVPRFTEVHRYRAVVVENVTDVLMWEHLDVWLSRMAALGYAHRIVVLNSAFASAFGPGAPQLRDRVYFVFWRRQYRAPDFAKWTRPRAWCASCGDVRAVMVTKPGKRRAMRYGQQYHYRCPHATCRGARVSPYVLPAASAIDWTITGQRIGDRARPLQPKTLARVEAGLQRYAGPVTVEAAGQTFERRPGVRSWPVHRPLTAVHTTASKAVACPPLLIPAGGTWNDAAQPVDVPMRSRTTRETEAVLMPQPLVVPVEGRDGKQARPASAPLRAQTARAENALVVPLRNNGVATPAARHPLRTFAAGGTHLGVVMRNNTTRGAGGEMSTPLDEPLRALTTAGHQSLVRWDHVLMPYDGRGLRPLDVPLPAQTTVAGDAVVGTSIAVEDCTFRMLEVDEIRAGMAFTPGYVLLGSKRERVRMLGNAVTPPAARDLVAAVVEAITGEQFDLTA
ncbi:DNA cytosine methyltransferase [Actinoplanes sp. TRM 88003]|uniref:DNA (cytosine-5-)-methyltransferase n=1 Tax=Paractinoplanes aksuensis TaxID=2939490 RepID=A0ABT1DPW1_9ACTN|nr:DNA cytosine methyltransferase [Actinoplanes aksuensis]MCO8272835.1 DNA cytosine methyltransferase [Actinoplanes aksuensis]